MAAGVMDLVLIGVVLIGGIYLLKSGVLNTLGQPAVAPAPTTPAPTDGTTPTTPPTDGTTTPTTPKDPLQQLLDQLLGQGGSNVLPTQPGAPGQQYPPMQQPPIYGGNPAECQSRYNGKCDTECKSGNSSLCQACQMACGGAQIGAVNVLPGMGGSMNPQLCKSKYNGKCNTECSSGNSRECAECRQACGSFRAYVQTPMNAMVSTVFRNNNYSYNANWPIGVANAR